MTSEERRFTSRGLSSYATNSKPVVLIVVVRRIDVGAVEVQVAAVGG